MSVLATSDIPQLNREGARWGRRDTGARIGPDWSGTGRRSGHRAGDGPDRRETLAEPARPERSGTIECPHCHATAPADSRFCPNCGRAYENRRLHNDKRTAGGQHRWIRLDERCCTTKQKNAALLTNGTSRRGGGSTWRAEAMRPVFRGARRSAATMVGISTTRALAQESVQNFHGVRPSDGTDPRWS